MKRNVMVATCLLVLVTNGVVVLAGGWNDLWGKWEEKRDPRTFVVFSPTNIVVSVSGTQEVWQVVGGTNLVTGLTVARAGKNVEAKSMVKFNEMIFLLGERSWLLRQAGSKDPDFGGEWPNPPPKPLQKTGN
jgi:hypothetical protein